MDRRTLDSRSGNQTDFGRIAGRDRRGFRRMVFGQSRFFLSFRFGPEGFFGTMAGRSGFGKIPGRRAPIAVAQSFFKIGSKLENDGPGPMAFGIGGRAFGSNTNPLGTFSGLFILTFG